MKQNVEKRSFNFEIRSEKREDGTAVLTGRPIVYESRTDIGPFDEIIRAGALDGADLKDVPLFVNHNLQMIPVARSRNNNANSTMQLTPDLSGLGFRASLDPDRHLVARELESAVDRGDIDGMSFMFAVEDEEWQDLKSEHPTRIIKRFAKIYEISAVTFPAYGTTEINLENRAALDSARAALDSARQTLESESTRLLELEKAKISLL